MKLIFVFHWLLFLRLVECLRQPAYDAKIDSGAHGTYPVKRFKSSGIRAPHVNFLQWSPECNDGLFYFITPRGWKVSNPGPMIFDGDGSLIWSEYFSNQFGGQAYDLKVQRYRGDDFLTFWLGDDTVRGHGAGHYYTLNSSYDIVHEVGAANSKYADLHDFVITPEGTALIIVFESVPADVRPLGRKLGDVWNQAIWDCLLQEIDLETGDVLFEWRASEHVNLTHTYSELESAWTDAGTQENPFDWFHLNSVQKDDLGNYVISARNPHAIYYIDGKTKETLWILGGKGNYFQDLSGGRALNFAWQHDARVVSKDEFPQIYSATPITEGMTTKFLTIFDNAALDWDYYYGPSYSRGLLLEVTYPTPSVAGGQEQLTKSLNSLLSRTVRLSEAVELLSKQDLTKVGGINGTDPAYTVCVVREYINPKHVLSSTQGSLQLLPSEKGDDLKVFVGYGINAVITEFAANGSVLCDIHFAAQNSWEKGDVQSYRAYKHSWVGRPRQPPLVTAQGEQVYVSWNGATEVRAWILQASDDNNHDNDWRDVVQYWKQGFETGLPLTTLEYQASQRFLRVIALDVDSKVCENGVSNVINRGYLNTVVRQRLGINTPTYLNVVFLLVGGATALAALHQISKRYSSRRRGRSRAAYLQSSRID